ncbi:hypothetical protein FXO38_03934 [Capsicum annuum]|nr:hypothetical protein FXO38_03934 [Capsicum annuum]
MGKTMSQSDRLGDEAGKDIVQPNSEANNMEQLNGDAHDFLNANRARQKDIEKPQKMGQQLARNINSNKDSSLPIVAGTTDDNQIKTLGVQSYLVTSGNNTNGIEQSIGKKVAGHVEKEAVSKPLDLQAKNSNSEEDASENWNLITHKKTLGSCIGSSTSQSNSPSWKKAALIGIGFALLKWFLVSKVRVSKASELDNEYNDKLIKEDKQEEVLILM